MTIYYIIFESRTLYLKPELYFYEETTVKIINFKREAHG